MTPNDPIPELQMYSDAYVASFDREFREEEERQAQLASLSEEHAHLYYLTHTGKYVWSVNGGRE